MQKNFGSYLFDFAQSLLSPHHLCGNQDAADKSIPLNIYPREAEESRPHGQSCPASPWLRQGVLFISEENMME